MNLKDIKLIASDIDGTLLLNGANAIDSRTIELIRRLTDHGVIFAAASGRQYENMHRIFAPIGDAIAYICYNGGLCVYRGEVIYQEHIEKTLAAEILSAIDATDDCDGMASAAGAELIAPRHTDLLAHMSGYIRAEYRIVDDLPSSPEPFYKVAMYSDSGNLREDYWQERFGDRCSVVTSGNVWLDFIPTDINKGVAIQKLMRRFGVTPDACAAFGDNDNDRDMLMAVGLPVVMQSAKEEMHPLGRIITPTVADVLEQILQAYER